MQELVATRAASGSTDVDRHVRKLLEDDITTRTRKAFAKIVAECCEVHNAVSHAVRGATANALCDAMGNEAV